MLSSTLIMEGYDTSLVGACIYETPYLPFSILTTKRASQRVPVVSKCFWNQSS